MNIAKPRIGYIYALEGNFLLSLRRDQEAVECLDKALDINPNDADALKARQQLLKMNRMKTFNLFFPEPTSP